MRHKCRKMPPPDCSGRSKNNFDDDQNDICTRPNKMMTSTIMATKLIIITTTILSTILLLPENNFVNGQRYTSFSNNLVKPNLASTYEPLIRQSNTIQQQQDPLIDNVIESTTQLLGSTYTRPQQQQQQQQLCQLPPTWMGKWYQSNKEPIRITQSEISDKGLCRDNKGDKYLFEYNKSQQQTPCLICLVMNERHLNVLQYKESSCQPIPQRYLNRTASGVDSLILDQDHSLLDSICSDITGDAQLESLFRLDTPAIECPINGKYHFTYDNCREPQSSLDSCIDKKQLNFRFSACPDVPGSESKSEVLKCYADWSEGNNYYMIGRLEHASNHQDKGKFRCFVYEKSHDGEYIQMAQSLEESCYGLINANEGPKTLRLQVKQSNNQKDSASSKCHFPSYIKSQSENWLSVDNSLIYMFNQNSTKYQVKETKEGNVIEEATCLQQFNHPHSTSHQNHHHQVMSNSNQVITTTQASLRRFPPSNNVNQYDQSPLASTAATLNDVVYLIQITKNCQTTDYCVRFHMRTNGIVQIDYFNALPGTDNISRCRTAYTGIPRTQIITSTNLEHQRCPFEGAYTIEAPVESDFSYNPSNIFICPRQSFLTAQCDHPSRLRIHYRCSPAKHMIKNLYCLGSWTTGGLVRLLLADDERQRYSAWYRDYGNMAPDADSHSSNNNNPQALQLQAAGSRQAYVGQTRSQQLMNLASALPTSGPAAVSSSSSATAATAQYNSLAPIVDLSIALLTPLPTVAKPMSVRLTRRHQCSELRGYAAQGSYSNSPGMMSSGNSMPSYAPSSSTSASGGSPSLNLQLVTLTTMTSLAILVNMMILTLYRVVS